MTDLLRPLRLGRVTLPNNLVLSPMAGFTDLPFRILCRRAGAGLVCTEMVAAGSVERAIPDTLERMRTITEARPSSIQVFGTDPEEVARATRTVERECDVVGFNMGCPAHQIRRQGCGAALLDRPEVAEEIVRAMRGATRKPLLVKVRAGNGGPMDVVAFVRRLERAGADGVILHARTARQGYSGRADWGLVRTLKDAVALTVVGNGDVADGPSAERALRESGADGIAVGRATLGDPRLFARLLAFLERGEVLPPPAAAERAEDFLEYLRLAEATGAGAAHLTTQAQQFARGVPGAARLRAALNGTRSVRDVQALFGGIAAGAASPTSAAPVR